MYANQPLICTMFDRHTFKARIKPFDPADRERFAQVIIAQHLTAKVKPTITYVKTALTGAQMHVTPSVEADTLGNQWLALEIELFVAASLAGQNFVHAELDAITTEVSCAGKLVRVELTRLGFTPEQIDFFMKYTVNQELEMTWHRKTQTRRAARALLQRAIRHFQALESISSRHDSLVERVHLETVFSVTGVLITFKNGCALRLYLKAEQAESRTKAKRVLSFVSKAMRSHLGALKAGVDSHLRIEPIFSSGFMAQHGLEHPESLTPEAVAAALVEFMKMARLDIPFAMCLDDIDTSNLSPEVITSLERHFDCCPVESELPAATFTRHRQALLPCGVELAVRRTRRNPALAAGLWQQLAYERRWRPPASLLAHAVTPARAAQILVTIAALQDAAESSMLSDMNPDGVTDEHQ
jgi:hypothetical protein